MKKYLLTLLLIIFFLSYTLPTLAPASEFKKVTSVAIDESNIVLYRSVDMNDSRRNPDGNLFFRTIYKVSIDDRKSKDESVIESDLYTPEDLNYNGGGMQPCLLIDPIAKVMTIFASGKGKNNNNYGMDGYAYRLDSKKQWRKEIVFSEANFGWFSYFGGSSAGNPELWHFAFAGYRLMRATRTSSGQWKNSVMGGIQPAAATASWKNKKNILSWLI